MPVPFLGEDPRDWRRLPGGLAWEYVGERGPDQLPRRRREEPEGEPGNSRGNVLRWLDVHGDRVVRL